MKALTNELLELPLLQLIKLDEVLFTYATVPFKQSTGQPCFKNRIY